MRRSLSLRAVPFAAALFFASELESQGWVTLPNGELGYVTNYTTTGFFVCGDPFYIIGTCSVAANSITLGSTGGTMTLTFTGLSQTLTATNVAQSVKMGTLTKSISTGRPYFFPKSKNAGNPLFYFYLAITTSTPLLSSATWSSCFFPASRTVLPRGCGDYWGNWVSLPTLVSPPGYEYGGIVFDFPQYALTVSDDPSAVMAQAGIVPEPATIWLTGTGIMCVAAALRRRRRKTARNT